MSLPDLPVMRLGRLVLQLLLAVLLLYGLGQAHGDNTITVATGDSFIAALADPLGPSEIYINADVLNVAEASFTGYDVPVVLKRNVTVIGNPYRYALINASYTNG
ncbi:hypothetical protein Agub_g8667, partial [Astrephomene gubernaculifera]